MQLVWRLATATTLIVLAFAMTAPVLAVLLQQRGHVPATIGAFAMLPFAMVALLIPVMPRLLARWGVLRVYRTGVALELAGAIGYAAGDGLLVWSLSSIVSGLGAAALWNATESLLAQEAPPEARGRVMGLYQTALGAALALGPFAPGLLQLDAQPLLWLGAIVVVACQVLVLRTPLHRQPAAADREHLGTWQALRTVPWLATLAFAGGVFEAGLSAIGAAQASSTGAKLGLATSVAGAIGIGSFLCQYPAGWAADRFRLSSVFTAAALLLLAASVAIAFAGRAAWLLWACGLVWGGVGGALYTLSMVQVAHAFAGRATAGGAAAMITGYTLGGAVGPLASGAALQGAGLAGLASVLGVVAVAALVAAQRMAAPQTLTQGSS